MLIGQSDEPDDECVPQSDWELLIFGSTCLHAPSGTVQYRQISVIQVQFFPLLKLPYVCGNFPRHWCHLGQELQLFQTTSINQACDEQVGLAERATAVSLVSNLKIHAVIIRIFHE